jgi:hypothetical protein
VTSEKISNPIMMSLHSLQKAIAAKKMKNKQMSILISNKMSDVLIQNCNKVIDN